MPSAATTPPYLLREIEVVGIRYPVDQERPIDIAAWREFVAGERTKGHDAEVRR